MAFLTHKDLPQLIALDRLQPVLVRCGGARFTCPAQDLETMMRNIEAGGDYVRDVSIPSADYREAVETVRQKDLNPKSGDRPMAHSFDEADCGGVYDGRQVWSETELGGAPGF